MEAEIDIYFIYFIWLLRYETWKQYLGPVHKLRYHNMGGGQSPGRYNVIYGQEFFKKLEKICKNRGKMMANLKNYEKFSQIKT